MNTPMPDLTLSAVVQDVPDEDATAAARFEDLLELRSRAAERGYRDLHELYTDQIVDELV